MRSNQLQSKVSKKTKATSKNEVDARTRVLKVGHGSRNPSVSRFAQGKHTATSKHNHNDNFNHPVVVQKSRTIIICSHTTHKMRMVIETLTLVLQNSSLRSILKQGSDVQLRPRPRSSHTQKNCRSKCITYFTYVPCIKRSWKERNNYKDPILQAGKL